MTPLLDELLWYPEDIREGLQALAVEAGLPIHDVVLPPVDQQISWFEQACEQLGLDVETTLGSAAEIPSALLGVAPGALLMLADRRVLLVVASGRRTLTVLSASMKRVTVRHRELVADLRVRYRATVPLPAVLDGFSEASALYAQTLATNAAGRGAAFVCLPLRVAASQPLALELRERRVPTRAAWGLALLLLQNVLAIGSTLLLGRAIANGRVDSARILGWALAMATQAVLQGLLGHLVGSLNIDLASALKRRLIEGALTLEPDFVRQAGIGANLSIAAESATVDQLSVSDVTEGLSALLVFGTAISYLYLQDPLSGLVLWMFFVVASTLVVRFYHVSRKLTALRIKLTDVFVERVLGHHTRLVQLPRSRWHDGEDEPLHAYVESANSLDRVHTILAVLPRAALVILVVLQARLVVESQSRFLLLLPLVAGFVAMQSLGQLVRVAQRLIRWPVSLRALLPILSRSGVGAINHGTKLPDGELADGEPLMEATGLRFAYDPLRPPVLDGLNLTVRAGDQVLVTGPSGGGKSTLAAVLTGLRQPNAGLVMLRGLDQHSVVGSEWRRHVVSAPQFHENYIFQNTLAFNLLMSRAWPPTPDVLEEAEEVCRELGLGALLDSMPAGIEQIVGETGWRLSHGERSRVFIARALLQNADVLIFDESFGALDPETLVLAMDAVRRRARTLLVISHK